MIAPAEIAELDATAQAQLVAAGEVSVFELLETSIGRIESLDPALNAVIHRRFERAVAEASEALPPGPFRGVPLLLKDYGCRSAGDPYHAGTRFLRDRRWCAACDSPLTGRFRAAGFVIVGRTNTPELAMSMTTEPAAYGPTRNPWDLERSAGGSSGGSSAAVAAGMVAIAHASDGGGSLRIPASACGLVGLKPSRGRIDTGRDGAPWHGLLVDHVVCRSVRDTGTVLEALSDLNGGARSLGVAEADVVWRLRIGVLDRPPSRDEAGDPDCAAAVLATAKVLQELGHELADAHPPALAEPDFATHFLSLLAAGCAREVATLAELTGETADAELEPATFRLVARGRALAPGKLQASADWLRDYGRRLEAWWRDFDLLLTPVLGGPPPPLGWFSDQSLSGARANQLLPYVRPFNVSGQPAISLPLHRTAAGLPIGVQLVAASGREDLLLGVAAQLEEAMPWRDRRPVLAKDGGER